MRCDPKSLPSSHPCSVEFTSLRHVALHRASRGGTQEGGAGSESDPSPAQNVRPRHTKDDGNHNTHTEGWQRCCNPARQRRDEPQPAASGPLAGLSRGEDGNSSHRVGVRPAIEERARHVFARVAR